MSALNTPRRAALRALTVIALSLFVACEAVPDIRRVWLPAGVFGYGTNLDGVVTAVDADSPANRAAMQPGDRVDVRLSPPQNAWLIVQQPVAAKPGDSVSFDVARQGVHRTVTLASTPEPMSDAFKVVLVAGIGATLLVVTIGAALVLLRPSPVTWGFFLFCVGNPPIKPLVLTLLLPYRANDVLQTAVDIATCAGLIGLLVFALRFLSEPLEGWRRSALQTLPYLFILLTALWLWQFYQTYVFGGPPAELLGRIEIILQWVISFVALYAFVDTYVRAHGADRQRIQWVVLGFAASLVAASVALLLNVEFTNLAPQVYAAAAMLNVIAPLTFAYAIFRYRVIDVSFVVSRALVYGVLTTLLVGVFSIIDWFFTDYLRIARLGTIAEVGAVVAFGLWFNGLHKRVDSLVDATFFRQRHRAEVQLARNAAALQFATTPQIVAKALVVEPTRALGLASAALFRRQRDQTYVREASEGWSDGDVAKLDESDGHLLMLLQAEHGPLSLYDHPWRTEAVPRGAAQPIMALPIIVRRELAAIAVYGAHIHGEPLDPDEIRAIGSLATGAAAAYDHLEAESMSRENEKMRYEVDRLLSILAEAKIQPA